MLPLNLLRVFHVVAREQNMVKASELLFVSQPAVSNALKKLQSDIGIRLFYKNGRNLCLTEHGQELYKMTGPLFTAESEIERFFEQIKATTRQSIHIGLVTIYERFGIEKILQHFSQVDHSISVSIHSGNSQGIAEMLLNKKIDMGISGDVLANPSLAYQLYQRHEVFMVVPAGHRLYGQATFTARDVENERMVLKETGSSVRRTINIFFEETGITPQVITELSNLDSILNLVRRENCITFLPDLSVPDTSAKDSPFSAASHAKGPLCFNTYIVYHKDGMYTEYTRKIIEQFRAVAAS